MARHSGFRAPSAGFTLVEMSIVLIIIGIILGAVIKGKDLIRSGEQKKIYNNFIQQWQIAYQNYFDRTGWVLGDVDNADNDAGAAVPNRDGLISDPAVANVVSQLQEVGIDPPPDGPSGDANQRLYSSSDDTTYSICLNLSNNGAWGNHMELTASTDSCTTLTGLPNDLAIALDNIIDGQRGGASGDFQNDDARGNGAKQAEEWGSATDAPEGNNAGIITLPF